MQEIADLDEIGLPAAKQRLRRGRMALVSALATGAERRHALKGVPMRCWDARQHVSDYLDGTLDTDTARTVEAHLERCPTCPPLYAALVGVHDAVGKLRDTDSVIPPPVAERLAHLVTSTHPGQGLAERGRHRGQRLQRVRSEECAKLARWNRGSMSTSGSTFRDLRIHEIRRSCHPIFHPIYGRDSRGRSDTVSD